MHILTRLAKVLSALMATHTRARTTESSARLKVNTLLSKNCKSACKNSLYALECTRCGLRGAADKVRLRLGRRRVHTQAAVSVVARARQPVCFVDEKSLAVFI
eukprot:5022894-Pyramimonas_sp.AAC.1